MFEFTNNAVPSLLVNKKNHETIRDHFLIKRRGGETKSDLSHINYNSRHSTNGIHSTNHGFKLFFPRSFPFPISNYSDMPSPSKKGTGDE